MSGGVVNREEWALVINEVLDEIPRRNKSALSRLIGFSERTIDRWLLSQLGVTEASVRQVAERTGRNPMELLIRVGYWSHDQLPAPPIPPEDQWIVDVYNASSLDEETRNKLLAVELANAQRDRDEKRRRIAEQLDLLGGGATKEDS